MAMIASERQLAIYEVKTDDGGVGLQFGDGPVFLGYDGNDLMRLLGQVFGAESIDADLHDLAHAWLDEATAQERFEELASE